MDKSKQRSLYDLAEHLLDKYEQVLRVFDSYYDSSSDAVAEIDREIAGLRTELASHKPG